MRRRNLTFGYGTLTPRDGRVRAQHWRIGMPGGTLDLHATGAGTVTIELSPDGARFPGRLGRVSRVVVSDDGAMLVDLISEVKR